MVTHHLVKINRVRLPILLVVHLNRENEYFPVPVRIRARDSMTRFSLDVESERACLTSKFSGANGDRENSEIIFSVQLTASSSTVFTTILLML